MTDEERAGAPPPPGRSAPGGEPVEPVAARPAHAHRPRAPAARPAPLGHEAGRPNRFMAPGSRTRVIGISSGKGGVGKSSVTVNLAVALAAAGPRRRPARRRRLRLLGARRCSGVTRGPVAIDDLLVPPVVHGVRCLSMGFFVPDEQPVIWRGPMLHKALEQFLVDAYWGEPDFLLIDMPPGTGDVALSLGQYLPRTEILVVTTPQPAAQRVAQRSAYAAKKLKLAVRGVIENMSWFTGDDGTRYELFGAGGGAGARRRPRGAAARPDPARPRRARWRRRRACRCAWRTPTARRPWPSTPWPTRVEALGPARIYRRELTVR